MNLWILQPIDAVNAEREMKTSDGRTLNVSRWTWDCANGFVVRASTEDEARLLASTKAGDEGDDAWLNPKFTSCEPLNNDGETEIVLRDFLVG